MERRSSWRSGERLECPAALVTCPSSQEGPHLHHALLAASSPSSSTSSPPCALLLLHLLFCSHRHFFLSLALLHLFRHIYLFPWLFFEYLSRNSYIIFPLVCFICLLLLFLNCFSRFLHFSYFPGFFSTYVLICPCYCTAFAYRSPDIFYSCFFSTSLLCSMLTPYLSLFIYRLLLLS